MFRFCILNLKRRFEVPEFSELHELPSNEVRTVPDTYYYKFTDSCCSIIIFLFQNLFLHML